MTDVNARPRAEVDARCVDENLLGEPEVVASPSGRYRLTIYDYGIATAGGIARAVW